MAWSIKRLVSAFKRAISRPHRPRSSIIRSIMEHAGIPVPAASTAGSADDGDESVMGEGEEEEELEVDPPIEESELPSGSVGAVAEPAPLMDVKEEMVEENILSVAPPPKKHRKEAPKEEVFRETGKATRCEDAPKTPSEAGKVPSKAPSVAPSETGKARSEKGKAPSEKGKAPSKAPKAPTTETREAPREAPTTTETKEAPTTTETREAPTTTETREDPPARKRVKDPSMLKLKHALESAVKRKKTKNLEEAGAIFKL